LKGAIQPLLISRAEGIYLYQPDGKKIIDAVSSWWVNLHGHSNPEIADAISEQARKLEHVIFAGFTHEPAIELAENLLRILPRNQKKIFFSDNGSTAVEVAIKLSLQYWHNIGTPKTKIIALEGAYHGDTFGSMAVGSRGMFNKPFESLLFDVEFIPVPTNNNLDSVKALLIDLLKNGDVASFIYEPLVQAAAGMVMYPSHSLDEILAICHQYNVICIADEVFTGFGRTGRYFASDYLSHKPDLMAISKGITGGALPLGVTSVSGRIVEAFQTDDKQKTFFHGHSYTANPLACAAANASYKILIRETTLSAIQRIGEQHLAFKSRIINHQAIKEVRCIGTIVAIEIISPEGTHYFNSLRDYMYHYFLERGMLLRPLGNVVYILPPYVIGEIELLAIYNEIEKFLDHVVAMATTQS
jgi:adenosylmethionine-8-amino-7-oxononanoate aminotransferase